MKHAKDFGQRRIRLVALFRVQSIEWEVISAVVLDRKDRPIPLPLAGLRARVIFAVAGELCDLAGAHVVPAAQDVSLSLGLHAGLQESGARESHLGQESLYNLVQLFLLARTHQLWQNFADTAVNLFRSSQFVSIFERNRDRSPGGGLLQKAADLAAGADNHSRQWRSVARNARICLHG